MLLTKYVTAQADTGLDLMIMITAAHQAAVVKTTCRKLLVRDRDFFVKLCFPLVENSAIVMNNKF